jgi:hypothetical protein
MGQLTTTPKTALTVTTYAEFKDDIQRFVRGLYNFLIVIGDTGIGKTETIRRALPRGNYGETSGKPSAFGLYCFCHDHRDQFLLLDDLSPKVYTDPATNAMLKRLTETKKTKQLDWTTKAATDRGYPQTFKTNSRVIITVNDWQGTSQHIKAIEGRAKIVLFKPTLHEVHMNVSEWFTDQEVFDFVIAHHRIQAEPDMRLFGNILAEKRAGAPWHKRALEMMVGNSKRLAMAEILLDPRYTSNNQRQEAFVSSGFGSRATFYTLLKEFRFYQEKIPDGKITLQNPKPTVIGKPDVEENDEHEEEVGDDDE